MPRLQTSKLPVDNVCNAIIEKIAEIEKTDPLEVTPPLSDVIDLDALSQIFATTPIADRMDSRVTFPYNGCEVTVRGDGEVFVEAAGE